jgi:hypothetical protein
MIIELHNGKDAFHISRAGWGELLELGQIHGWQPAGTEPPQWNDPQMQTAYADQNGIYTSVNDADARALALALEGALPDIPDDRTNTTHTGPRFDDGLRGARRVHGNFEYLSTSPHPSERLAGKDMQQVLEFVAFAKQGRFSVRWG